MESSVRWPYHSQSMVGLDRSSIDSFETERASCSSSMTQYSTFSLPGPKPVSPLDTKVADTESWRSLLPESDPYSLLNGCFQSHNALSSPSGSDHLNSPVSLDGSSARAAFFPTRRMPLDGMDQPARRHASFSGYNQGDSSLSSNGFGATRSMLSAAARAPTITQRSIKAGTIPRKSSPLSNTDGQSQQITASSSAMSFDDMKERESWPSSRGASACNSTTAWQSLPSDMLKAKEEETTSIDQLVEKSDSIVHATVATTTTATVRTSTTKLLIPPCGSVASASGESQSRTDISAEDQNSAADSGSTMMPKARSPSCSISTPASPPSLPFLDHRPAPPETELVIETSKTQYTLVMRLPGFSLDCITLATKQHRHDRTLHIVADKWDAEGGGHFERRITFPEKECDLRNVKAEFDGKTLRVFVPRNNLTARFSSASSATF